MTKLEFGDFLRLETSRDLTRLHTGDLTRKEIGRDLKLVEIGDWRLDEPGHCRLDMTEVLMRMKTLLELTRLNTRDFRHDKNGVYGVV